MQCLCMTPFSLKKLQMKYNEDSFLLLSGIQHFVFCERQWALIHIEQQWEENKLTLEGKYFHKQVDDPWNMASNRGIITIRALSLIAESYGLIGKADAIELWPVTDNDDGINYSGYPGLWKLIPIEYKKGKPKPQPCDIVQLCAQAMCLEEMFSTKINNGFLYYGETRHRYSVEFSTEIRFVVQDSIDKMHWLFDQKITPKPHLKPCCKSCSLIDICLPKSLSGNGNAMDYLNKMLFQ